MFSQHNDLWEPVKSYLQYNHLYTLETSESITRELYRFLLLKSKYLLLNLGPSSMVDEAWHAAILNTEPYARFCKALCNDLIHHTTSTSMDSKIDKNHRINQTLLMYERTFAEAPDPSIWKLYTGLRRNPIRQTRKRSRKERNATDDTITVYIKKGNGDILEIQTSTTRTIEQLKRVLASMDGGVPEDQQRLIWAGKVLQDKTTLQNYGISNQATIHLVTRLRGC